MLFRDRDKIVGDAMRVFAIVPKLDHPQPEDILHRKLRFAHRIWGENGVRGPDLAQDLIGEAACAGGLCPLGGHLYMGEHAFLAQHGIKKVKGSLPGQHLRVILVPGQAPRISGGTDETSGGVSR